MYRDSANLGYDSGSIQTERKLDPMKNLTFAMVACALLAAGCATVDAGSGNSLHATSKDRDMNYLTGSKIPLRGDGNAQGVKVSVPTDLERQEMSTMRQTNPEGR
jgi:predicted small secreted protein